MEKKIFLEIEDLVEEIESEIAVFASLLNEIVESESLNQEEALDIADKREMVQKETKETLELDLEDLLEDEEMVFLPPLNIKFKRVKMSEEEFEIEKEKPKLKAVLEAISEMDEKPDYIIPSKILEDSYRSLPYFLIVLEKLDRLILVCNEINNMTFVREGIKGAKKWASLSKIDLKKDSKVAELYWKSDVDVWKKRLKIHLKEEINVESEDLFVYSFPLETQIKEDGTVDIEIDGEVKTYASAHLYGNYKGYARLYFKALKEKLFRMGVENLYSGYKAVEILYLKSELDVILDAEKKKEEIDSRGVIELEHDGEMKNFIAVNAYSKTKQLSASTLFRLIEHHALNSFHFDDVYSNGFAHKIEDFYLKEEIDAVIFEYKFNYKEIPKSGILEVLKDGKTLTVVDISHYSNFLKCKPHIFYRYVEEGGLDSVEVFGPYYKSNRRGLLFLKEEMDRVLAPYLNRAMVNKEGVVRVSIDGEIDDYVILNRYSKRFGIHSSTLLRKLQDAGILPVKVKEQEAYSNHYRCKVLYRKSDVDALFAD